MKKLFAIAAMAATVAFASCNKNEEKADANGKTKSVFLRMEQPGNRSEGPAVSDGYAVKFNSGGIYFVTNAGSIAKYYSISTAATSTSNLNLAELSGSGAVATNVPADAAKVYVVGNIPGSVTLPTTIGSAFSVVQEKMIGVATQTNAAKNVDDITLFSAPASMTLVSGTDYEATAVPLPIAGRIELEGIRTTDTRIAGFEVKAIYVNKFYNQMQLNSIVAPANLQDAGSTMTNYGDNVGFYTTGAPYYNYYASAIAATGTPLQAVSPTASTVWAYNLLAGASGQFPHIVIQLSNITTDGSVTLPDANDRYLTIKSFKKASDNSAVTSFDPRNIYKLAASDFDFTFEDLKIIPELGDISATVNITLLTWTAVGVKPSF